jgi:hypothetical protein
VSFRGDVGIQMAVTSQGVRRRVSVRVSRLSPEADISRSVHIDTGKLLLASLYPSVRIYHSSSTGQIFVKFGFRYLKKKISQ